MKDLVSIKFLHKRGSFLAFSSWSRRLPQFLPMWFPCPRRYRAILRLAGPDCLWHDLWRTHPYYYAHDFLCSLTHLKAMENYNIIIQTIPSSAKIVATPIGWLIYGVWTASFRLWSRCFMAAKLAVRRRSHEVELLLKEHCIGDLHCHDWWFQMGLKLPDGRPVMHRHD